MALKRGLSIRSKNTSSARQKSRKTSSDKENENSQPRSQEPKKQYRKTPAVLSTIQGMVWYSQNAFEIVPNHCKEADPADLPNLLDSTPEENEVSDAQEGLIRLD